MFEVFCYHTLGYVYVMNFRLLAAAFSEFNTEADLTEHYIVSLSLHDCTNGM